MVNLSELDEKLEKIKSYRPLTKTEVKRLREEFIYENVYNSNAIEGNRFTLRETYLLLKEGIVIGGRTFKEHLEIAGLNNAVVFAEKLVKESKNLSTDIIKQLHRIILFDDIEHGGVYRPFKVTITGALIEPPEPYVVPIDMESLVSRYNVWNEHIVEKVARFHLEFESIHPFVDGNGRVGRLIMNLELMRFGFLPINIMVEDRERYYSCFTDYDVTKEPNKMIELVTERESEELDKYIGILETREEILKSKNIYED